MTYPPNQPDQPGGYQYDPYGSQGGSPQSPQPGGYSPQPPQSPAGPPQPGYGPPQPGYGPPQMPPPMPGYGAMPPPQLPQGLAVASMVVGICSVVLCWVPFVNLVLGILALSFGGVGLKRANLGVGGGKGMAITGVVLGSIICALFALGIVLRLLGVAMFATSGAW